MAILQGLKVLKLVFTLSHRDKFDLSSFLKRWQNSSDSDQAKILAKYLRRNLQPPRAGE